MNLKNHDLECGFPMSNTVKSHGLSLGKSTRDLACQSAERWRDLKEDAGPVVETLLLLDRVLFLQEQGESFNVDILPIFDPGMNLKKRHEVEILAAVINSVAKTVDSHTVVDVGSGQGYLAQVLSFQYNLSVLAIDGSLHHGEVTKSRAERIKKHYAAKMRKLGSEKWSLYIPKTITCRVLSANMLKNLSSEIEEQRLRSKFSEDSCLGGFDDEMTKFTKDVAASNNNCSLVLAGVHACGDLSVTMLRAFSECSQVSALVSIGCCYNLLSEDEPGNHDSECGFPMSNTVKSYGLSLGKSTRDLACQSAERWRDLKEDAGIQNFDLHAFRAAFQIVLDKYYPQIISSSPSIGRQGKIREVEP
ncbi:hypothetical protein V2J09_015297 [Rumex salicifolius]